MDSPDAGVGIPVHCFSPDPRQRNTGFKRAPWPRFILLELPV